MVLLAALQRGNYTVSLRFLFCFSQLMSAAVDDPFHKRPRQHCLDLPADWIVISGAGELHRVVAFGGGKSAGRVDVGLG